MCSCYWLPATWAGVFASSGFAVGVNTGLIWSPRGRLIDGSSLVGFEVSAPRLDICLNSLARALPIATLPRSLPKPRLPSTRLIHQFGPPLPG